MKQSCCLFAAVVCLIGCSSGNEQAQAPATHPGQSAPASQQPPSLDFRQQIAVNSSVSTVKANSQTTIPVTVTNTGASIWNNEQPYMVTLSYQWWLNGQRAGNGDRTTLPRSLNPGEAVTLDALVTAPAAPGKYNLRFTMVREGVQWFSDGGGTFQDRPVSIIR